MTECVDDGSGQIRSLNTGNPGRAECPDYAWSWSQPASRRVFVPGLA